MHRVSTIFTSGFGISYDLPPKLTRATCAMCGVEADCVPSRELIKANSTDLPDMFRHSDFCCPDCAACFSDSRLLTSNLYADEHGVAYKPMIAQASATEDRPSWRDLVRSLEVGTQCVALFTSNTKRRLWPGCVVSPVGAAWRVLFVDGDIERLLTVNYHTLLKYLDFVEFLMADGFSKRAISTSLLSGMKSAAFMQSATRVLALEAQVAQIRGTDEFTLALFIAQKEV